jgi:hypothetical protein
MWKDKGRVEFKELQQHALKNWEENTNISVGFAAEIRSWAFRINILCDMNQLLSECKPVADRYVGLISLLF